MSLSFAVYLLLSRLTHLDWCPALAALSSRASHWQQLVQPGALLGIFIWVGQSKAQQILGRTTGVVYVGIMGMTRALWVGHVLPGLIARTASVCNASHVALTG